MRSSAILALAALLAVSAPASGQSWKTIAKARQHQGQDALDVRIKYAVGHFELGRGPDGLLYRLNSRFDENAFKLRSNYLESAQRGKLSIELEGHDRIDLGDFKDYDVKAGSLRLELSNRTPLNLRMELGAVEARLDLGGLRVQELGLETGASDTQISFSEPNPVEAGHCSFKAGAASLKIEALGNSNCRNLSVSGGVGALTLDFSGDWKHDATGEINVGLGAIEIRVPAELGVRIDRRTFLMAFDAPDLVKQDGGVWLSRNWETAKRRLTLSVSGALGGVEVARF